MCVHPSRAACATGRAAATCSSNSSVPSAPRFEFSTPDDFLVDEFLKAEPLLGEGTTFLARRSLLVVYRAYGSGKSMWTIDGVAHLAAGVGTAPESAHLLHDCVGRRAGVVRSSTI